MDERLKHRLIGAAVLVSLGVIFIPMVLDNAGTGEDAIVASNIPPKPSAQFSSRVVPVGEPASRIESEPLPPASVEADGIYGALPQEEPDDEPAPTTARPAPDETVSMPAAPPAGNDPAAEPSPSVADGVTAWAVQLGSFSNAQNAIALRDRLRTLGYTAFVESAPDRSRSMTRVFVGPELLRSEAVQVLEKLRTETKLKGIVVRYPAG